MTTLFNLGQLNKTAFLLGERILTALIIFIAFWLVAMLVKRLIIKIPNQHPQKKQVFKLLASISKITIVVIGLITALGSVGLNVSAIVASLGLTGFALGFALKDFLSNILAGIMILLYQPYRIGNTITVTSSTGVVIEINLRYTVLEDGNSRILIPNSTMLNSIATVVK